MYVLSIKVSPRDVRDMHDLSINGMNAPSVHVLYHDLEESRDVMSDSGIHSLNLLNVLGLDLTLNGLNGLNGLVPE